MTKEQQTPEILARPQRAYECYLATDDQGKRPSAKAIALKLGVTESAVKYWKRRFRWDDQIAELAGATIRAADAAANSVRALLRAGALESVAVLRALVSDKRTDTDDRIKAAVALFKLAKELDAIDPTGPAPTADAPPAFHDDVPLPTPPEEESAPECSTLSLTPSLAPLAPELLA